MLVLIYLGDFYKTTQLFPLIIVYLGRNYNLGMIGIDIDREVRDAIGFHSGHVRSAKGGSYKSRSYDQGGAWGPVCLFFFGL